MHAIVTGMIATYPVGGVAWDYGQYALGLQQLGFDVYYLEDTGGPTYNPHQREYVDDCQYGVQFLETALGALSRELAGKWHFRSATGDCYGIDSKKLGELCAGADLFVNVSGGTLLRDEYMPCPCKVLIDTDPGWNHFVNYPRWDANPGWQGTHGFRGHDHFFTYAERIGKADCLLPTLGLAWQPTRPPVSMDHWRKNGEGKAWTTVMTWNNYQKPVEYQGRRFGTKEMEFKKIEAIPERHSEVKFELAIGGAGAPVDQWRDSGWSVVDSHTVSVSPDNYRIYIQDSRGEISVAKNLYVASRSGWFSCRSACYLASGRPVIVQDTGFAEILPTGDGLFSFSESHSASQAISTVEADYSHHSRAAQEFAGEYLDGRRVLGQILRRVGMS